MKQSKIEKFIARTGLTIADLEQFLKPKDFKPKIVIPYSSRHYKFAIVSDTHLCDKHCAVNELRDFYRRIKKMGITEVVHAGDLGAGFGVYRGQIQDLIVCGFDDQRKYIVEHYPQMNGIKTYFISGNHDFSTIDNAGANLCAAVAEKRKDLVFLGDYNATVRLNGMKIMLQHGAKGQPYAMSYHLQKYVEKLGSGRKPQIYVLGHYHSALYMFYRNIHTFLPGCFQRANAFTVRLGLPECIGAWIIECEVLNDSYNTIRSITKTFIAYY
jgi:predicted phosphodiesterase